MNHRPVEIVITGPGMTKACCGAPDDRLRKAIHFAAKKVWVASLRSQ
jgi:hypothetical protein